MYELLYILKRERMMLRRHRAVVRDALGSFVRHAHIAKLAGADREAALKQLPLWRLQGVRAIMTIRILQNVARVICL
jgi:hypothetical protein